MEEFNRMVVYSLTSGALFLLIGFGGKYWIGRNAFHRRNAAGVEEFTDYKRAVGTRFLEGTINLICSVLYLLGVMSLLLAALFFVLKKIG